MKDNFERLFLEKFFENRNDLIDKLENGTIDKSEYIEKTHTFIKGLSMGPFINNIDSYEKAMYNYQYYNIMAKDCNKLAKELKYKDPFRAKDLRDEALVYYKSKDKQTSALLDLVKYKNVEAYYVKTDSRSLKGELYEVVFKDFDRAIFHSKSKYILNKLRKNNVFSKNNRKSLIDDYINTTY